MVALSAFVPLVLLSGIGCVSGDSAERTATTSSAVEEQWGAVENSLTGFLTLGVDVDGALLYPCRTNDGFLIGKTRADWNACDIALQGAETWVLSYEILRYDMGPFSVYNPSPTPPSNAFAAGWEADGTPLYPCMAWVGSDDQHLSWQVGKFRNGFAGCHVPFGGNEIEAWGAYAVNGSQNQDSGWDILLSTFGMTFVSGASFPPNAMVGGWEYDGTPLYFCRAPYQGGLHPGKMHSDWGSCDIAWGGQEIWVTDGFEVLTPKLVDPGGPAFQVVDIGPTEGICVASFAGSTQVGQYSATPDCTFAFGGSTFTLTSGFQVLSAQ
jgi:hypothetical protein